MRGHFEGTAGNGKCLRPPEKSSGILAGEVETFSSKRRSFGNLDREISEYAGHDSFSPPKPRAKSPSDLPLGEYNFKHIDLPLTGHIHTNVRAYFKCSTTGK